MCSANDQGNIVVKTKRCFWEKKRGLNQSVVIRVNHRSLMERYVSGVEEFLRHGVCHQPERRVTVIGLSKRC